jgi:L-fuculose-phosphate aldolase
MSNPDTHESARRTVSECTRQLVTEGLVDGGAGGTVSERVGDHIAISPADGSEAELDPDSVPLVDETGEHLDGYRSPTADSTLHAAIYRELDDVGGVIHTHSPYATTFASLGVPIRATNYVLAFAGTEVPVAEYASGGTDDLAAKTLELLDADTYHACLARNHGLVVVGDSLDDALERTIMVEAAARVDYQARSIGEPAEIPRDDLEWLRDEAFATYGQSTDHGEAGAPPPREGQLPAEREAIAKFGRELVDTGLTQASGGNLSVRTGELAAISPSGVPYHDIVPQMVPIVRTDGKQIAGELKASNEYPIHTGIYRARDDVRAVVHTHSPYASTFAGLDEPIPASHTHLAFAGTEVPVAGWARSGSERLTDRVVDTLGADHDACLLRNHGTIAVGESLEAAFETALMLEYCARIHYQAKGLGDPEVLPDAEIEAIRKTLGE